MTRRVVPSNNGKMDMGVGKGWMDGCVNFCINELCMDGGCEVKRENTGQVNAKIIVSNRQRGERVKGIGA